MKKIALAILTACRSLISYAQTDTTFWFAAPDVSSAFNYDRPILLRITSYQQPCNITVSQPAGGGLPTQTFSLAANSTQTIDLTTWINSIECAPGNVVQNKGIKIKSDNSIAAYYEANANGPNPELFALKGRNALGNEFYISSQYILGNSPVLSPLPISSFNIVASEDNTSVTITPAKNIVGHVAGIPFVITLNRGQTYAAIATSQAAAQHLQGSHVISTKPVAVTLSDDLLQGTVFGGPCEDLAGDQTVPVNIIGTQYIAVKSNLNSPFDKLYITATQNATSVSQDGVFVTNLNAGASVELTVSNPSTYIQSSAPVYAYQLSGLGCEVGSAILPKLDCTGSSSVSVTRSTGGSFVVTLLVKNGGQNNFLVNNVAGVITAAQFSVVPATGGVWYAAKVTLPPASYPNGSVIRISNTSNIFQMGIFEGDIQGVAVGYFSDFNSLQAHASAAVATLCVGSNIQLNADFIPSATYGWTGPNGFTSASQNPTITNATVANSGVYRLTVTVPGCGVYLDSVTVTVSACPVLTCNNWLATPSQPAYVNIGDLDVTGSQLTVEAVANRTSFYPNGTFAAGADLVSKHSGTVDANYLLRSQDAELTTTNGFFNTPPICAEELNKTYHYAMVYDGATLKYYRNGFLMSQVAATGNLIQNNLATTIGWLANHNLDENFIGYINEVRIWNVARTQTELRTYMNTSLPVPTTQVGLKGYYTFDDLSNKQGNAAFNGTLGGSASINATNPNCSFIPDSCSMLTCNNWLATPAQPAYVTVGDLDIPGNQVTIEATANRTSFFANGVPTNGDLVSKHSGPSNVNYTLRPTYALITTVNGFFFTPPACEIELNKTYHYAMVYDGATLKFYRNGFLMGQVAATGNLIQNDLNTTIAWLSGHNLDENFVGYINEVRIWNVAKTQSQIQAYMNTSLPTPAAQPGLLAYYTFDDLLNKQGNATWNGTLGGGASINAANPNCTFIADSCRVPSAIGGIINDYTPVLGLDPCKNLLTVEDGTKFNAGDTVLLIQMKGAIIDSTNTSAFGTVTNYNNAGNYEFNYVKSRVGNVIELKNKLTRQYNIPAGKVQLIRVPYYNSVTITSPLTCLAWDGNKGGVLVLNVKDTITLQSNIDISGKGFNGAPGYNPENQTAACFQNNYYYSTNTINAALKGESIATISDSRRAGKGALAAAGGGGDGHNSGGGGGGNGSAGGFGGYQLETCGGAPFDNRGIGGLALPYSTAANRIFMGSGGGGGHADNIGTIPPGGGNGAGIAIIIADKIQSNSNSIIANGDAAVGCVVAGPSNCHDGMGGGGSGGTVLININQLIDNTSIISKGGKGADVTANVPLAGRIGPGGGGAGGVSFLKFASVPGNLAITNTGGISGVGTQDANNPWGATAGSTGINLFNLVVPFDNVAFVPNIDSVRIKDSSTSCVAVDFKGFGYTNTGPITIWEWYFGDGGTANTQNTSHTYGAAGTFTVKLVVTDINGCKDSISKNVNTSGFTTDAGVDTAICSNSAVSVTLHGNPGATTYSWTPAIYLNDPTLQEPVATISSTTRFYLTATSSLGCGAMDSVTVTINPVPVVKTLIDTAICKGSSLVLTTTGIASTWHWSPGTYVSDSTISNPSYADIVPHTLFVTGTNVYGCTGKDTIDVTIKPLPIVKTIKDTIICSTETLTLFTTGAQTYSWSPINNLSDPNIANPVFSGTLGHTYYVTGTAANGCKGKDTVSVSVNVPGTFSQPPGKSMCSAGRVFLDGANGGNVTYLWSPGTYLSDTTSINPIAFPPATTYFQVVIWDKVCNYDSTFSVHVIVNALPLIDAGKSNDIDCAFKSANLYASGGVRYLWTPSIGLNNDTIPNPIATPSKDQRYIVTVTNASGCSVKDTVIVYNNPLAGLARYMPNAFAPNSKSAENRCYGLLKWLHVDQLNFVIYNRWGEMMFATSNPNGCWDGTYKGKPADQGTYVYYIKAITACGTEVQKGNFILIR